MPAAMLWQDQGEKSTRTVVALLIIQSSYQKKKVSLEEQRAQEEDRLLHGRQIAYMIYDFSGILALMIPFLITLIYSQ